MKKQEEVLKLIHDLKSKPFKKNVIHCDHNGLKYELILLTADCSKDKKLMDLLGRWRKENEAWFLSQFNPTLERTTRWFDAKVTNTPDRMLFIISVDGKHIGHIGLFRFEFDKQVCEIDNILRGEPGYPGIIENAIKHMLDWGRENLGLRGYLLKVLSHNDRAIKLYNRLGFREISKIPLVFVDGPDGPELKESPDAKKPDRHYSYMRLDMK